MRRRIITLVMAALVAMSLAAAPASADSDDTRTPPSKEACKDGGFEKFGFKNQGQCIKAFNKAENNDKKKDD